MTAGLDYQGFVNQIATLAVVDADDPNFLTILPQAITYVENRLCRELNFLFTSIPNTAFSLTANSRNLTIPTGTFIVPEQINVIYPFNASVPGLGTRNPLLAVTREFLDATCSDPAVTGLPKYFAPIGDRAGNISFLFGPYPDAPYQVEIVGTIRPDSLSAINPTTFISTYLPDLMVMGAMIYVSGYQRNFGATQANDPQMPISYETQYQSLLMGAMTEESRRKFEAAAWSPKSHSPVTTPTRG
jgi:hypothetical protein